MFHSYIYCEKMFKILKQENVIKSLYLRQSYVILFDFKVEFSKFTKNNWIFHFVSFSLYIKMFTGYHKMFSWYHKKIKKSVKKKLVKGITIFLKKKKKTKKREYCRERYKNLSEDEKERLVEYRRNYYIRLKN